MAGQDGRRRTGRQQMEEPAASQDEPGSTERPPPRRSGRTASATPAPEAGSGRKKGGRAGAKSAPPKAGGSKRPRSTSPAPPASKKVAAAKGKAAAANEPLAGKSSNPPSGRGKQAAPASGGRKNKPPPSEGKASASGGRGRAAAAQGKPVASGKAKSAPQKAKSGGKGRRGASAKGAEELASEEEEELQEGSGSEGSDDEQSASGSEASGSEEGSGEDESEEGSGDEAEEEEEEEEEVDQTIYAPPKTAALPEEVTILEGDAEHGTAPLTAPSAAVGELLAAYNALRAFSWQLRISPFSFPDFVAAMTSTQPTPLVDEVHCCVLRALCIDETPKERAERKLDPALLDHLTWPAYVWEFLALTEDPLAVEEWVHRVPLHKRPGAGASGAENGGRHGSGKAGGSGGSKGRQAASAAQSDTAADGEATVAAATARRKSFAPLSTEEQSAIDAVLDAADPAVPALPPAAETFSMPGVPPQPAPAPAEYHRLPVGLKAAILSRLCDHLLDCLTIRAEVDRREAAGEMVAGKGGAGGAFPIMTEEERKAAEEKAAKLELSDANADVCVLCGVGGTLLCCDACPAAYHVRCVGESSRAAGATSWYCPECRVGGRGECAGLRIPVAARNRWKQPLHLMHGTVCRSAPPAVRSSGKHAEELEDGPIPAAWYHGEAAKKELAAATRVKGQDEAPPASAYDAVDEPPEIREEEYEWGAGPAAYVNRYRHAWPAAVAAINAAVDDAKRRRHRGGIWVPTGTCGRLTVPELPAPLGMPRFTWEQSKLALAPTARCGRCKACLRPSLRKPCPMLLPRDEQSQEEDAKLATLVAQVVRLELDYWPLAEGPWAGGEGMAFRRSWLAALRSAGSVREVAHALLQLEAALRPVAFVPEWRGSEPNSAAAAAAAAATPAVGSRPASRAVSRAPSGLDLQGLESQGAQQSADLSASQAGTEGGAGGPATRSGFDAAAAAAAARAADPYDVRYEKPVFGGWEMDKRHHSARMHGVNRLPRAMARKAARQSGWKPIQGVKYRKFRWHVSPRTQWIAATERAETAAQLALSLRQLDPMLQVDTIEKPRQEQGEPFFFASLLAKRPAGATAPEGSFEYLLQIRPPTGPTAAQQEAVAAMLLEQQKAIRAQLQLATAAAAAGGQGGAAPRIALSPEQAAMLQQAALQLPPAMQQQMVAAYQQKLQMAQQAAASGAQGQSTPPPAGNQAEGVKKEEADVKAEGQQQQHAVPAVAPAAPQLATQAAGSAASNAADAPAARNAEVAAAPVAEAAPAAGLVEPAHAAPAKLAAGAPAEPASASAVLPLAESAHVAATEPGLPNGSAQHGSAKTAPADAVAAVPSPMEVDAGVAPAATPTITPADQAAAAPVEAAQQAVAQQLAADVVPEQLGAQLVEAAPEQPGAEAARPADSAAAAPSPREAAQQPLPQQQQPTGSEELPAGQRGRSETPAVGEDASALAPFEAPAAAQAAKLRRQEAERAKAEAEAAERAAKLAARQSAANLSQLGSDAAARAAGGLATASLTTEQLVREAQASREPVWAHESLLPLWLVEQYEERLRREAGNAAAREAAARARHQRHQGAEAEEAAATRAAAHQAAAKAADACGACEAFQGEKEELDAVWLSCDTCHRWFHGGCVRMSRDLVDSMGEGEAWDCQACKSFKRQQERAAARNQRQVKPPQAFSPDQERGKKGGRPPLPAGKRRDGEEEEAAGKRGSGRGRKRAASTEPSEEGPLDPEEVERRRLERQERIRRRREEQGAPPESEPWFCPVCKYPDRGRPLFECADCKDSFHFECAGMHAEEFAAKVASGEAVKCLACQGKRVRAPSQAAINAAILAAQRAAGLAPAADDEDDDEESEEEEDDDESGSSDEEQGSAEATADGGAKPAPQQQPQLPAATKVLSPLDSLLAELAKAMGISVHTASSWMDAVLRVLIKVMRLDCAAEFSQPVDLASFPDYAAEIAHPMDLGTIKSGLHAGKYGSPLEVLEHVKLVWSNCRQYNEEGSDIMAECNSTVQAFEAAWRLEGLPSEPAAWQPERAAELRVQAAARLAAMQQEERARLAAAASAAAGVVMPGGVAAPKPAAPKPAAPKPAQKRKQPESFPATAGGAPATVPVATVVGLSAPPAAAAAGSVPAGGMLAGGAGFDRPAPASKRSRSKASAAEGDWQQRAMQALQRLMQLEASEAFHEPVPRDVPGYHDVIKKPRCLEQIQRNLQRSKYASPAELLADVQLVWDNCREYNEPDAPVVAEAAEAEAYWRRCWAAAGIYVSQREMDEKAAAAAQARAAAEAGKLDSTWRAAARKILFRMQKVKESSWFWAPVRAEDAPGYHDVVARPMDLATISDRLKRGGPEQGGYGAATDFLADMQLVWENCRAYNGDDHAITQDAAACRRQFENWWLAAGLTLSGQLASSELREAGREGVSAARQQRQQGGTAAVGAAGAARSLAEDPVLQALMRKLPPEKQQQVVGLLQRMTPDQMGQARAQLQAMAGVQAAPAAPAGPSAPMQQLQAQQGASYYGQQAAPQQAYPQAYQEPQQQAAYYPQQQQVQVQQVQPQQAYGGQAYGQAQLQQQQLLMQQQAPQQQALYAQQHVQQQPAPQQWSAAPAQQHMQQQLAAQQWAAAPVQQPAIGGWQEPALQQQQQPATAWQPAARQLLEGLAALPAAAPFLQAQPGFLQGMDLNSVASKLAAGAYARPLDLAADVSRMLQGAAGAPEGSELRMAAGQVQAVFEALWQRLLAPFMHF